MKNQNIPGAILFDFGGVLVEVHQRQEGYREVAQEVYELVHKSSRAPLSEDQIETDLRAGALAYDNWKNAQSRRAKPREITHREFWEDFVAPDWPTAARSAVIAHATLLCQLFESAVMDRPPKDGALMTLQELSRMGIPTGCVSNALAGAFSRDLMHRYGFDQFLAVQIYSDEVGMRKPNPEIFHLATDCLGVRPEQTWYIGDKLDRDVLSARRANLGRAILLPSKETGGGARVTVEPDSIIESPTGLLALIDDSEADG